MQLNSCCRRVGQNLRDELWSYCALAGILLFNTSIVLLVYAYKRATQCPLLMEIFGITLLILGVLSTLASWYVHRQQRQKKRTCFCPPCCCRCCRGRGSVVVAVAEHPRSAPSSATSIRKAKFTRGNGKLFGSGGRDRLAGEEGGSPAPGSGRPFSTPEFRKYAEFVSHNTAGVETLDSPRSNRSVYPGLDKPVPAFVNPRFQSNSAPQSPVANSKTATKSHVTLHMQS